MQCTHCEFPECWQLTLSLVLGIWPFCLESSMSISSSTTMEGTLKLELDSPFWVAELELSLDWKRPTLQLLMKSRSPCFNLACCTVLLLLFSIFKSPLWSCERLNWVEVRPKTF